MYPSRCMCYRQGPESDTFKSWDPVGGDRVTGDHYSWKGLIQVVLHFFSYDAVNGKMLEAHLSSRRLGQHVQGRPWVQSHTSYGSWVSLASCTSECALPHVPLHSDPRCQETLPKPKDQISGANWLWTFNLQDYETWNSFLFFSPTLGISLQQQQTGYNRKTCSS